MNFRKYRLFLYSQDPYCTYCNIKLNVANKNALDSNDATLDHIVPKRYNGPSIKKNFALCCSKCNKIKRDQSLNDFLNSKYLKNKIKRNCKIEHFYGY